MPVRLRTWAGGVGGVVAIVLSASCPALEDGAWLPGEGIPGVNEDVHALHVWNDGGGEALYIGGRFTFAVNQYASHRALRWHILERGRRRLVPKAVAILKKSGMNVVMERSAGESAGLTDSAFEAPGAQHDKSAYEVTTRQECW
jgi:hypothetical protein